MADPTPPAAPNAVAATSSRTGTVTHTGTGTSATTGSNAVAATGSNAVAATASSTSTATGPAATTGSASTTGPQRRMPAHQRQQQILEAAVEAFAEFGYAGSTTDQIARIAGVSQPYVVRMFGGKHALFIAAHNYVVDRIETAFREAVEKRDESVSPMDALGLAYLDLIPDRNLLRMMQHSFTMGADPQFGPPVRDCLVRIYRLVRELTGATAEEANAFVAHGLLINTLVTVQLPEIADSDPYAAEFVKAAMGDPVPGTTTTTIRPA